MLIVLRLFKAFAAQQRMGFVVRTLDYARTDLLHFLIVFFTVFFTFVLSGTLLFGHQAEGFTTFNTALITCVRALRKDFNWDEVAEVGLYEAGFWYVGFMTFMLFVMMNMLTIIFVKAYREQKEHHQSGMSLWTQTKYILKEINDERKGRTCTLRTVLKSIKNNEDKLTTKLEEEDPEVEELGNNEEDEIVEKITFTLVTVEFLEEYCPALGRDRAIQLIQTAVEHFYICNFHTAGLDDMIRTCRELSEMLKNLKIMLMATVGKQNDSDSSQDECGAETEANEKLIEEFVSEIEQCRQNLSDADDAVPATTPLVVAKKKSPALPPPVTTPQNLQIEMRAGGQTILEATLAVPELELRLAREETLKAEAWVAHREAQNTLTEIEVQNARLIEEAKSRNLDIDYALIQRTATENRMRLIKAENVDAYPVPKN